MSRLGRIFTKRNSLQSHIILSFFPTYINKIGWEIIFNMLVKNVKEPTPPFKTYHQFFCFLTTCHLRISDPKIKRKELKSFYLKIKEFEKEIISVNSIKEQKYETAYTSEIIFDLKLAYEKLEQEYGKDKSLKLIVSEVITFMNTFIGLIDEKIVLRKYRRRRKPLDVPQIKKELSELVNKYQKWIDG